MKYRDFGKTGVAISALGFGAMRLPMGGTRTGGNVDIETSVALMHQAFGLGVNYVDTAYGYCNGQSEVAVGAALQSWKDSRVYVSTKMPLWLIKSKGDGRKYLEEQMGRLKIERIDFLHLHGLKLEDWNGRLMECELMQDIEWARSRGLFEHLSFSSHDAPENMITLMDTGLFESLLCQYNLLDRRNEPAIDHGHAKGIGVVVMGPVAGGKLVTSPEVFASMAPGTQAASSPEIALRFVLSNEKVSCALSGMSSPQMVAENAAVCSRSPRLSAEEEEQVRAAFEEKKKLKELYCTGCKYCMPCPQGVNIAHCFEAMSYQVIYGNTQQARFQYGLIGDKWHEGNGADACTACGACLEKCPQNIAIPERLAEVHKVLGEGAGG